MMLRLNFGHAFSPIVEQISQSDDVTIETLLKSVKAGPPYRMEVTEAMMNASVTPLALLQLL